MNDPAVAAHLASEETVLIEKMMEVRNVTDLASSAEDARQFMVGFVRLMQASASGDDGPRDEYLSTVIPAIRDAGMPLTVVLDGMVRVAIGATAILPEHALWFSNFCANYTVRLLEVWGEV